MTLAQILTLIGAISGAISAAAAQYHAAGAKYAAREAAQNTRPGSPVAPSSSGQPPQ